MSVWLTPDLKPFYGGTYFPPTSQWGRPGLRRHPAGDRARLAARSATRSSQSAEALTAQLRRSMRAAAPVRTVPGRRRARADGARSFAQAFDRAARRLRRRAEVSAAVASCCSCCASTRAPATPTRATWCCARCARWRSAACAITSAAASIATRSTRDWRVPHFEKMLYDQAQLVLAYLEAAQVSGDPFYARGRRGHAALRHARDDRRGRRLLLGRGRRQRSARSRPARRPRTRWKARSTSGAPTRLDALLGDDAADRQAAVRHRAGRQRAAAIRSRSSPARTCSTSRDRSTTSPARPVAPRDDVVEALHRARLTLFEARLERPRPHLDDKVLTAWNGLMIAAFARWRACCAAWRRRPQRRRAVPRGGARAAARSSASACGTPSRGTLLRRYRDGHAEIDGYAEDYAYLIFGLLELFQADPAIRRGSSGRSRCSAGRTSCSGTTTAAAGSARPASDPACCCG